MYTVEDLRNTFIKKHQEKLNDRHYRDEIQPLFKEDGSFNRGNWSSFQDDIRSRLESSEIVCCDNELHIECRKPDENNEDCTILSILMLLLYSVAINGMLLLVSYVMKQKIMILI